MRLRSIIIDDEPIARRGLEEDLREINFIEIIDTAENAIKAIDLVASKKPDLIFLDIEMPRMNGLELIKNIKQPPLIIITSAYSKYAIKGYELDVTDYLIKPINFNRLLKACTKAREFFELKNNIAVQNAGAAQYPGSAPYFGSAQYFFVKSDGKLEKILLDELCIIEGANNYVILHIAGKKLLVYDTMKNMLDMLPQNQFARVHKSFIVAVNKISGIEGHEILIGKYRIKMSRNIKTRLVEMLTKR